LRGEGIALLVVLVVFVILYLVVYQLHFSTTMEARIAQVRYGEAESSSALHSVALYVMTLLVEDLKEDASGGSAAGSSPGMGGTADRPRAVGKEAGTPGPEGDSGIFTPLVASSGSSKWVDYLHENIFKDNRQQVGDITVKIRLADGERAFDLNQLFDYPILQGDAVDESGIANVTDEDLQGAVQGKSDEAAALSLRDKVLEKSRQKRTAGAEKAGGKTSKDADATAVAGADGAAPSGTASTTAGEYEVEEPFVMPEPERIEATRRMLERAIVGMFSMNENNGFVFPSGIKYSAGDIASSIIQYVLERRQQPFQNRIYLVTELLNIPGITPEVFYGPLPFVPEGEEFDMGNGFVLRRDDFGELTTEYLYGEDPQLLEEQNQALHELESQFGQFADLAGYGFDPMKANPLTRGMSEQLIDMDQDGKEYVVDKPFPMGLRDLFTTWSSGKINLNTAPYPVIFAMLLSLSDDEANLVALDIRDYRNRFQEEVEEEGVERVSGSADTKSAPELGQPKRKKKEEAGTASGSSKNASASSSLDSLAGMDPAALDELSAYQDVETNYFTSLDQLELIDGTEGDASDRLRKDEGVERVDVEQDTLLRRVQHDLGACVFGSTYFNAELRAKPKQGGAVKVGHLSLRRDTKRKMVEVLMWKNFQK